MTIPFTPALPVCRFRPAVTRASTRPARARCRRRPWGSFWSCCASACRWGAEARWELPGDGELLMEGGGG